MSEKAVIVHRSVIEEWSRRPDPPLPLSLICGVLARINEVVENCKPEDLIRVEESANTGFKSLPDRVGIGNSARLFGARAGYCLRTARVALEDAGIPVVLDSKGSLP